MASFSSISTKTNPEIYAKVCAALDFFQESLDVEYKRSATWEELEYNIIKAAMAMANIRGGGILIIGADEKSDRNNQTGILLEHLDTYKPDILDAKIHKYASPQIDYVSGLVKYRDRDYLVIAFSEFSITPVITKKGHDGIFRAGDIYVRQRGPVKSAPITDAHTMSELLDLATEKRTRHILQLSKHVGLEITDRDDDLFIAEAKTLNDMKEVEQIESLPHFYVVIRPETYDAESVGSTSELWSTIRSCGIRKMGWRYPILLENDDYQRRGNNWIGAWSDLGAGPDRWKLFQSGQYVNEQTISGCYPPNIPRHEEWARGHNMAPPDGDWKRISGYLGIKHTIKTLASIVEFASQISQKEAYKGSCVINVQLVGILNTALVTDNRHAWYGTHMYNDMHLEITRTYPASELLADATSPAIDMSLSIFSKYGWDDVSEEVIKRTIDNFRGR